MAIGRFAGVTFETSDKRILTPAGFKRTTSSRFANHEVNMSKPKKEYLGPGLTGVTFSITLDANFGVSPSSTINQLEQYEKNGLSSPLIIGGRNLGRFVIMSKSESYDIVTNGGKVVQEKVDLTLEEYR